MKVIVVGAGIAGLSSAWALARRGVEVHVLEQGPIPFPMATSYDEHRITRHAYGEMHGYARLMPAAFQVWDALFGDIGARHFDPMPVVVFQREEIAWLPASLEDLDALHVGWRELPLSSVADRYPMIETAGLTRAVETDGGGVLFPIRILTDLVRTLGAMGVKFHPKHRVTAIDTDRGAVVANGRTFEADHVVVAAGAWLTKLFPDLAGTTVPSRQAVAFLAPPPDLHAAWAKAPVFIDIGLESGTYTLPPRPGTRLKVGDHQFSRTGDPDGSREGTDEDVARLMIAARLAYRDFDRYTILERKACFYTVTEDESFHVKPLGPKATVQSACSGHGFKLAPLMGDGVARAILGEPPHGDLAAWAAGR